jgi:hypothetical protein
MPHRFDPTILREYDIRGIVGTTLFPADAEAPALIGQDSGPAPEHGEEEPEAP